MSRPACSSGAEEPLKYLLPCPLKLNCLASEGIGKQFQVPCNRRSDGGALAYPTRRLGAVSTNDRTRGTRICPPPAGVAALGLVRLYEA